MHKKRRGMMRNVAIVFFAFATFVACQKKKSKLPAKPKIIKVDNQKMRRIRIDSADRSCKANKDCTIVMTQCSCSCGKSVNRSKAGKYTRLLSKKCKGYRGRMCAMSCPIQAYCMKGVCNIKFKRRRATSPPPRSK